MKTKVNIKGAIVPADESWIYELFGIDHTSTKTVAREIEQANGGDLDVVINSGGGSVFDASEIYTELMNHQGNVEVSVVGLAASAASVIAMAGNKVKMAPTAQMMVHNASAKAQGDHHRMDKMSDILEGTNKTIAHAYRLKSGLEESELLDLMDKESWLTPDDALNKGLIDEVMFTESEKVTASYSITNMLPQEVIDGVRNGVLNKESTANVNVDTTELQDTIKSLQDQINELKQPNNEPTKPANNWLF